MPRIGVATFSLAISFGVGVVACERTPAAVELRAVADAGARSTPLPAPSPSTPTSNAVSVRSLPALELTCKADLDCAIVDTTLEGEAACCAGCRWHPGTKSSIKRLQDACAATPPPSCPGLGCAMPIVAARCMAEKCVAQIKR